MNKYTIYATIRLDVESELEDFQDVIDEFEQNSIYDFQNTPSIEVKETEWVTTSTVNPYEE